MCGIVGIAGNSDVAQRLFDGLKRLEYRGYDSAGICTIDGGKLERRRAEGKLENLAKELKQHPLGGTIGGFDAAIRARLFTELGAGVLDLDGVLAAVAARDYDGWLMVEQDSSWPPPSEAAAIGRRVLADALATVGRQTTDSDVR